MTRFGVMKHLKVLEQAGLVVTRRRGREKLHFLNPVPIRLVHDRWVSKYAEPWAATLSELKHDTRGETDGKGIRDLHQDDARATLGGDHRQRDARKYNFGVGVDLRLDAGLAATRPSTRARRARSARARTWRSIRRAGWCRASTRCGARTSSAKATSRVTWEIEPVGDSCRLTVTHDQLREGANDQLYGGWPMILSGLKTLLETGESLDHARLADVRTGLSWIPRAPEAPAPGRAPGGGPGRTTEPAALRRFAAAPRPGPLNGAQDRLRGPGCRGRRAHARRGSRRSGGRAAASGPSRGRPAACARPRESRTRARRRPRWQGRAARAAAGGPRRRPAAARASASRIDSRIPLSR